jgi:hypothetical protein
MRLKEAKGKNRDSLFHLSDLGEGGEEKRELGEEGCSSFEVEHSCEGLRICLRKCALEVSAHQYCERGTLRMGVHKGVE